jgi:hypothetical protein
VVYSEVVRKHPKHVPNQTPQIPKSYPPTRFTFPFPVPSPPATNPSASLNILSISSSLACLVMSGCMLLQIRSSRACEKAWTP